ncbi:MAG TPA: ATP-binding protein [Bryobacteraceae bacterium]
MNQAIANNSHQVVTKRDAFWLFVFGALTLLCPGVNYDALILLPLFGAFQFLEPHLVYFKTDFGRITSVAVKLVLSYLLIGYTHGLDSIYFPILLLPVVVAATQLSLAKTLIFVALTCAAYPSFLLFLDLEEVSGYDVRILCIRVVFFIVIGFLVFEEANAKRKQLQRAVRAETELQRSERLTALDQLTAGLAHELRNPLTTAKLSAEMLMKPRSQGNPQIVSEVSGFILSELDRTESLISKFLNFAKPLTVRPELNDLATVIEAVCEGATSIASASGVVLSKQASREHILFVFDAELIKVAVHNLVKNAVEASSPGQVVLVKIEEHKDEVLISVSDSGHGIDPKNRESIFNPFFTTKADSIGLGLAMVTKIVDASGGRVSFTSVQGSGTIFRIVLPHQTHSLRHAAVGELG